MPGKKNKRRYKKRIRRLDIRGAGSGLMGFLPKVLAAAVGLTLVLFLFRWADNLFSSSPFFAVSRIELTMRPFFNEALSLDFYNIPRRCNVFRLDIDTISRDTERRHPEFKSVVMTRKPPNAISVNIKYKEPVAFIRTTAKRQFFYGKQRILYPRQGMFVLVPISSDGITLPADTVKGKIIPVLRGVDFQMPVVKVGTVCPDRNLIAGIRLLKVAESCWAIKDHRLDAIELSNPRNVSIFLENGIEVRLGEGNIREKIGTLKGILETPRLDLSKIRYIDLRFSDVVVGPK
jgi:cell division septal protein FtsQ